MKYIGILISSMIIISLLVGAVIYLSDRCSIFFPIISRKTWVLGFISLLVLAIICMTVFATTANPVAKSIFIFGGIALSLLISLFIAVASTDLLNLFFKFSPQVSSAIAIGFMSMLSIYGVWNAYTIQVKELTIPVVGLKREIRAVHITDAHLGNFRGKDEVEKIVRKIKELHPEIVFNTGDMFDSKSHFTDGNDVLEAFRSLNAPHYFVYGNHDEQVGIEEVIKQMKSANAIVLQNEISFFGELQIIGLNNMLADRHTFDIHSTAASETIADVMHELEIKQDAPTIVLHHRPDGVKYMQQKDVDLLLAGHTHGGQLFPFTFIAKLMFGYNNGLYRNGTMQIYVSEGTGTIFTPIRLGTKSELTLLKLIPKI